MVASLSLKGTDDPRGAQDDLAERIQHMFSPAVADEREFDARLSAIAEIFLQSGNTSSEATVEDLFDKFSDSQIKASPGDQEKYLASLSDFVVTHSMNTSSPRFIGHMTSALP